MNVTNLLKALEDDQNESLLGLTTNKITKINLNILKELHLSKKETAIIIKKLKGYKYIDEIDDLKYGTYIRWIPLNDKNNITLLKGAIFCEIKITDEGTFCICKNYGFPSRYFQIMMDSNLIFQKLTAQEKVLLSALDHLSK
jgi:hypothetical protein